MLIDKFTVQYDYVGISHSAEGVRIRNMRRKKQKTKNVCWMKKKCRGWSIRKT
jgi:hypothetical protein